MRSARGVLGGLGFVGFGVALRLCGWGWGGGWEEAEGDGLLWFVLCWGWGGGFMVGWGCFVGLERGIMARVWFGGDGVLGGGVRKRTCAWVCGGDGVPGGGARR